MYSSAQKHYEEGCALLGEKKCAEITAYWSAFFDAKFGPLPKLPLNWRSIYAEPPESWTSAASPLVEADLLSPAVSEDGKSRQQSVDVAVKYHSSSSSLHGLHESWHGKTQMDSLPSAKGESTVKKSAPRRVGPAKDCKAPSRTSRPRARSLTGLFRRCRASHARRASSCPSIGKPPVPLTAANLALGMYVHSLDAHN